MRDFRKTLMVAMGTTAIAVGLFAGPLGVAAQDDAWQGVDDGTTLTMWTRAATEARSQALVDAYNASHQNQIELTRRAHGRLPDHGRCRRRLELAAGPLLG